MSSSGRSRRGNSSCWPSTPRPARRRRDLGVLVAKSPTIVCFPCKHQSLCAACYEGLLRSHEAAKREKQRLERAHRRLPDDVRRDAVLRCPYCRATAEYASVASTSRLRYSWGEEGGSCTVLVVRKVDCLSVLTVLAACITASAAQGSSH
mmetsp:Transcript_36608/g.104846  ORF Transcript_36608/g.104846 Transcript_36608/m.104846 type:complete len:150 (-) Transcript_36608:899-1348(-)